ncbi:MAG TPA: hypothetical protein VGA62_09305 [Acidimicrobiia bacterium]
MTAVLIAGLGDVGVRTARQLLDTPGIDRVLVAARDLRAAREVASALQDGAEPVEWSPPDAVPEGVRVIASAVPGEHDVALARAAIAAGVSYACSADHDVALRGLLALDVDARAAGTNVVIGCGMAPGLSDVLARHACGAFDSVDELHVARWGVAGDASISAARRALREPAREWRDGLVVHDRHRGPELVWFPDPVGARECELVATGVELLVSSTPGVGRVTARLGVPATGRFFPAGRFTPPGRRDPGAAWGAVRVEAWGWQGATRASIVYGVIERTAVAAGTVLGVVAAGLAGALPTIVAEAAPGACGLGTMVKPVPFLAELSRRGVKAATFEGVAVA